MFGFQTTLNTEMKLCKLYIVLAENPMRGNPFELPKPIENILGFKQNTYKTAACTGLSMAMVNNGVTKLT